MAGEEIRLLCDQNNKSHLFMPAFSSVLNFLKLKFCKIQIVISLIVLLSSIYDIRGIL